MKRMSLEEIKDVLIKLDRREEMECRKFYKRNPDADEERRRDKIIAQGVITRVLYAFTEAMKEE